MQASPDPPSSSTSDKRRRWQSAPKTSSSASSDEDDDDDDDDDDKDEDEGVTCGGAWCCSCCTSTLAEDVERSHSPGWLTTTNRIGRAWSSDGSDSRLDGDGRGCPDRKPTPRSLAQKQCARGTQQ